MKSTIQPKLAKTQKNEVRIRLIRRTIDSNYPTFKAFWRKHLADGDNSISYYAFKQFIKTNQFYASNRRLERFERLLGISEHDLQKEFLDKVGFVPDGGSFHHQANK